MEQLEDRLLLTSHPLVNIHLEVTDLNGNVIQSVDVGQEFLLNEKVQDLRSVEDGKGVFAVYNDVEFASDMVDVIAAPTFNSPYVNGKSFNTATDGVIDEWGAFAGLNWLDTDEYLVSSVKMQAEKSGDVLFSSNPADLVLDHDVLLYAAAGKIPDARIVFGTTSLHINYPPVIIDDGDTGFSATNAWTNWNQGGGYNGDFVYVASGDGTETATWQFNNLAVAKYRVWATHTVATNRPSNVPFAIYDDDLLVATATVDQRALPDDLTANGSNWEQLGEVIILDGILKVRAFNNVDSNWLIADAVRIVRYGEVVLAPEMDVLVNGTSVSNGGSVDLGQTTVGTAVDHTVTIKSTGTADLVLGALDTSGLPSGFEIVAAPSSSTIPRGESVTIVVRIKAESEADLSGSIALANNDSDENPYSINFTAAVVSIPPVTIIDDGDAGFVATSGFSEWQGGYQGDFHYANKGNGSQTAAWNFTEIANGQYKVWTTWKSAGSRPSNAPYTISDDLGALATVRLNQNQNPNDLTADGANWEELGTYDVVGQELHVVLSDDSDQRWIIADAVRIERVGDLVLAPEIDILLDGTSVNDGGTVNLGQTTVGTAVDHVFTVKNTGTAELTLTAIDDSAFPSGITLVANIGATTVTRGQSTSFTLRVTATAEAGLSSALALANNDSDENPYNINFTATVVSIPPVTIIDDGDAGFVATSGFSEWQGGYQGDFHYANKGNGSQTAAWNFTEIANGQYKVWTTWKSAGSRPSNAPYTISDDLGALATVRLNQNQNPNDLTADGANWEELGTYDVVGQELHVVLSDDSDQRWIIADAVRIERVGDLVLAPEIDILLDGTSVNDGGTVNLGQTTVGTAVDHVFTVKNTGTAELTLTAIDDSAFPSGITLVANIGATTVTRGQSTSFTLRVTATAEAGLSSALALANNDSDENPYNINFTATVVSIPPVTIIDDGDAGFSATTGWMNWDKSGGFDGDYLYVGRGSENQAATWTFDSLSVGEYRVWTTWKISSSRPSDAPYSIFEDDELLETIAMNQRVNPDDLTAEDTAWEELGTYNILDGILKVQVTNDADSSWVIADAVRIERLGDLVLAPEISVSNGVTGNVADGGTVDFGNVIRGTTVELQFEIENTGTADLTLVAIQAADIPSGFSVPTNIGALTVARRETTTFTVRVDTSSVGTLSGTLKFANNDGDENPFEIVLNATVADAPVVRIVDDGDSAFSSTSGFLPYLGHGGRGDDYHYAQNGNGSEVARWTFDSLSEGNYRIWTTWRVASLRPSNAPYRMLDGNTDRGTIRVDQRLEPVDLSADGASWKLLGDFDVTSGTLKVELSNDADSRWLIADAVRIERIGDAS
jgi:hypothetical protein